MFWSMGARLRVERGECLCESIHAKSLISFLIFFF